MSYITVPEDYMFNEEFPTWIIAYCPDTNTWYCTNQRFFYYEHPIEFRCENDAIEYFRNHISEFAKLNHEMYPTKINSVFLENTREEFTPAINM